MINANEFTPVKKDHINRIAYDASTLNLLVDLTDVKNVGVADHNVVHAQAINAAGCSQVYVTVTPGILMIYEYDHA